MTDALRRVLRSDALAMSFVFPGITEEAELGALLVGLAEQEAWTVSRALVSIPGPLAGTLSNVFVRYRLPKGVVQSWVLGFGPFDCLPNTRRAPFVELAMMLRQKQLPLRHEGLNADISTAHLADLPADRIPDNTFRGMYDSTVQRKREMLEEVDDPRARARVTFTVKTSFVEKIQTAESTTSQAQSSEATQA